MEEPPARPPEIEPGEPAPSTGWYQLLNVPGVPTGESIYLEKGRPAPYALRGFTWRLMRRAD